MAILQTSLIDTTGFYDLPRPANTDEPVPSLTSDQKIVAWLFRSRDKTLKRFSASDIRLSERYLGPLSDLSSETNDDWHIVCNLCGHSMEDFAANGSGLPLTSAEIDHFRRNHREMDTLVSRDFLTAKTDLPSPLSELYGLYHHRSRLDTEAALFVAQATGSTRVARIMADMLAIGGFANGHECISHHAMTYSVPASFDTSELIDRANHEAARRLALPIDHPAHLLKLSPDEIGLLAANILENNIMQPCDFLEKANLLAEARQDVARLPNEKQFVTAIRERDVPANKTWVVRLCAAYARIFESWVAETPEVQAIIGQQRSFGH